MVVNHLDEIARTARIVAGIEPQVHAIESMHRSLHGLPIVFAHDVQPPTFIPRMPSATQMARIDAISAARPLPSRYEQLAAALGED